MKPPAEMTFLIKNESLILQPLKKFPKCSLETTPPNGKRKLMSTETTWEFRSVYLMLSTLVVWLSDRISFWAFLWYLILFMILFLEGKAHGNERNSLDKVRCWIGDSWDFQWILKSDLPQDLLSAQGIVPNHEHVFSWRIFLPWMLREQMLIEYKRDG